MGGVPESAGVELVDPALLPRERRPVGGRPELRDATLCAVMPVAAVRQASEMTTTCGTPQRRASTALAETLTASFGFSGAPDSSQSSFCALLIP
jgi:hypothetical protein